MSTENRALSERALQKNQWNEADIAGLKLLHSPLLLEQQGLRHAFSTRLGGKSKAPMESFNLGRHINDEEARQDAMSNRAAFCQALGVNFEELVVPSQVHSNRVADASSGSLSDVDAVGTQTIGIPLLLHFADCVPIVIYEPNSGALAVVHAGWKGTAASIVQNVVQFLCSNYAAKPEHMLAAVGPAIGSCCYPTSAEVAERLSQTVRNAEGLIPRQGSQPSPDLKAINAMQLLEAGVKAVDVTDLCTACQPELFYSYRQSGGQTGRQGALACLVHN